MGKDLVPEDDRGGKMVTEEKVLRGQGYRLTDQRRRIIDLLKSEKRHLNAEDIHALLHQNSKQRVSLATVYRTLELLTRLSLVKKVEVSGKPTVFELNTDTSVQSHCHLVCRQCGRVVDVPISSLMKISSIEELEEYLLRHYYFDLDISDHQIVFFGMCETCKEK
ncbi:transcriptional repressor [candidate division KSB1 bacterium]|nr:MAG: transcriptional repressor [candidate division KSB1 bacterium]RKY85160.1 MAG: transcriptional repressor [candidate division KSB1 bacterium]